MSNRRNRLFTKGLAFLCLFTIAMMGMAGAKSIYVVANHHTAQFDAYNINPPGTIPPIEYQARYNLSHADDPADVGVWMDVGTDPPEGALFITSEFDYGVELIDAKTMTPLGWVSGARDLAGIDIDDVNNIIYTVDRMTNDLYVYDWDPVAKSLALRSGYPKDLPGCHSSGAVGAALDEIAGHLYVADARSGAVRVYDVHTLSQILSYTPSIPPVGIAIDRRRGFVYTSHPDGGCAYLPQYGNYLLLSQYDLATGVETTVNMGHGGMGIAVDEATGYVYVTGGCSGDDLSVWDSDLNFIYSTGDIGNPAGIGIGNLSVNPLNLAKNDDVVGYGVYIGQTFTYDITYDNSGNVFDVTNVIITDNLPPELDFVSEMVGGVPGTGVYDPVAHTVTWSIGTILAGQPGPMIELVVKINGNAVPGTTIHNYCTIESDQTNPTTIIGDDPENPDPEDPGTYILPSIPVAFDIKPTSCPNPINAKRNSDATARALFKEVPGDPTAEELRSVIPMAILGTDEFDVSLIDPATILVLGVSPIRWNIEDVATPIEDDAEECECNTKGPDGYLDLTLKFDHDEIVAALGEVHDGDVISVEIEGELVDGTFIIGSDCVLIRGKRDEESIVFSISNQPNPFNPTTTINFGLASTGHVTLTIFNILGEKVATLVNGTMEAGYHSVTWNGADAASGVYLYRIQFGDFVTSRKMVLLK